KGRALKIAQEGVREFGCIGVKMYPPMGFQAWGNEGLPFWIPGKPPKKKYLWRASLGKELDARLRKFYEWCLAEDVPILTHSNATVLSRYDYYDRPNPVHWGRLLEKSGIPGIKNLRVLMGHFGGFGDEHPDPKDEKEELENKLIRARVAEIARLCLKFPNIYADLSYHEGILEGATRVRYARQLKALVTGPGDPLKKKLCYGSDWVMLARQPDNEYYRDTMESVISRDVGMSKTETLDVMGHNALRFLGVTSDGQQRERLANFYKSQKMSEPEWFNEAREVDS
ncbi:MAG: amidohydrolase family protein, partial [Verrucomicrobiae bacterium]|nr:amidohydrolase family protein [Verrucomicrobiae bacterium]